jgi:hypothetical protein
MPITAGKNQPVETVLSWRNIANTLIVGIESAWRGFSELLAFLV